MPIGREVKLLISSIVLIALGVVLAIQYTDLCRLEAVTLNGQVVQKWDQQFGLLPGRTVIRQPVDSLASALLAKQGITRVDIQYRLPNMLKISTNCLDPICYLIDRVTGTFFGLDESGRVVPMDISQAKWDMPIFTGLRVRRMHDYTDDYRANLVIGQIQELRQTNPALYQSIEEVDFGRPNFVSLGFAGKSFRLKVPADRLLQRFDEFSTFVSRYNPPMDSTSCFDMTYDDEIIRVGAVPHKELPPIDTASINDKADFSDEVDLTPPGTVEIPLHAAVSEQALAAPEETAHQAVSSFVTNDAARSDDSSVARNHSPSEGVSRPTHPSKPVIPVVPAATHAASPIGKGTATTGKKPAADKTSLAASTKPASAVAAKTSSAEGTKPVVKAHKSGVKHSKSGGASAPKGTATKKPPAKRTKSIKATQKK